jgi:hypothetical protein
MGYSSGGWFRLCTVLLLATARARVVGADAETEFKEEGCSDDTTDIQVVMFGMLVQDKHHSKINRHSLAFHALAHISSFHALASILVHATRCGSHGSIALLTNVSASMLLTAAVSVCCAWLLPP